VVGRQLAHDDVETPGARLLEEVRQAAITRDGDVEARDMTRSPLLVAGGAALDVVEVATIWPPTLTAAASQFASWRGRDSVGSWLSSVDTRP
jgi:hypothetical protein